jgi:hypothetical protein
MAVAKKINVKGIHGYTLTLPTERRAKRVPRAEEAELNGIYREYKEAHEKKFKGEKEPFPKEEFLRKIKVGFVNIVGKALFYRANVNAWKVWI